MPVEVYLWDILVPGGDLQDCPPPAGWSVYSDGMAASAGWGGALDKTGLLIMYLNPVTVIQKKGSILFLNWNAMFLFIGLGSAHAHCTHDGSQSDHLNTSKGGKAPNSAQSLWFFLVSPAEWVGDKWITRS